MRPPVEPPSAHHLLFPGSKSTSPAPRPTRALSLCFTRFVSASLSLYAFILAFPVNDRSDSLGIRHYVALSPFHAMQALHSLGSLQCVRELQCPQTRRRIFWVEPLALFQPQSLAMGSRSFFVSCNFLCQLQFWSHHLPRSATHTFPVRRFPSINQCLYCPTFASHNSILVMHKTAPVRS